MSSRSLPDRKDESDIGFAQNLMDEFAASTGLTSRAAAKRYLWTDAFAVCNFLELYRKTGKVANLNLALELVNHVHHILGRHRDDDPRQGWISGLEEEDGEAHPTCGGLRIGKKLSERQPDEPLDSRLEWDRDGQYFHYLTKWMHALYAVSRITGEPCFLRWATELAATAHRAFTYRVPTGGPKRMFWKMSIDLKRPLVTSMGHHDPLDALISYLELQAADGSNHHKDLATAIAESTEMCAASRWATDDALGIGGLLDSAARLARLVSEHGLEYAPLLSQLVFDAGYSLQAFSRSFVSSHPADFRLAFRELGLSIGIHAIERARGIVQQDPNVRTVFDRLLKHQQLADQIQDFWTNPDHRLGTTWTDHKEINTVMLATCLAPDSYPSL